MADAGSGALVLRPHPTALPVSDRTVVASTPQGRAVYVGVFAAPAGRTLRIRGVRLSAESDIDNTSLVTVTPRLCRSGSFHVTTDPSAFCGSLVRPAGATMHSGDEIVLEVRGAITGTVSIGRIRVSYREGWRRATQDAGAPARVSILPG